MDTSPETHTHTRVSGLVLWIQLTCLSHWSMLSLPSDVSIKVCELICEQKMDLIQV